MNITFFKGETVNFSIEIRGASDNILTDPTTITISISKDAISVSGTAILKINAATMTKSSVGKYIYNWTSDDAGSYSVVYRADNNSKITISKDSFIVN